MEFMESRKELEAMLARERVDGRQAAGPKPSVG